MKQKTNEINERRIDESTNHKAVLLAVFILSISLTTFSVLLLWNHNRVSSYWNKVISESASNLIESGTKWRKLEHDSEMISKTLRTVAESDERTSSEHAIIFSPLMDHIMPQKFKQSDKDVIPGRYLSSSEKTKSSDFETFNITPTSTKCNSSRILITIKSATDHYEHRMAVRESWAGIDSDDIQIIFLLGKSAVDAVNVAIEKEAVDFDDIVQGHYEDTYANLTLKALNGLEYRRRECNQPEYILAIDDDTFVDIADLKLHLSRLESTSNFIECSERTVVNGKVWRQGRWAVPIDTYESEKYPTYCNGPCYLMPKSTSEQLRHMADVTPHDLQADDAIITGIFRAKADIPLIQYTRTGAPGWCRELNNRKPKLPKRMRREFQRSYRA